MIRRIYLRREDRYMKGCASWRRAKPLAMSGDRTFDNHAPYYILRVSAQAVSKGQAVTSITGRREEIRSQCPKVFLSLNPIPSPYSLTPSTK